MQGLSPALSTSNLKVVVFKLSYTPKNTTRPRKALFPNTTTSNKNRRAFHKAMRKPTDIPNAPGVYLFSDADGAILYVGKAASLKKRLASYFRKDVDDKTRRMLEKAAQVDTITVRNEVEALLLENRLINQHIPPYNIMLRESRRYAWILVTDERFPRILTARNKRRRGHYYGPYTDGTARRAIVLGLNKAFRLRTCRTLPKRVCLQYHIGNCTGPCEGHDTKEEYSRRVRDAEAVLQGKTRALVARLEKEMRDASAKQRFEQAKTVRDTIAALERLETTQVVEREETHDQDVIGNASNEEEVFVVLSVRRGVIARKREYRLPQAPDAQETFLTALYREAIPPKEIIVGGLSEERARTLATYFSKLVEGTVNVTVPQRGDKRRLLELAQQNATLALTREDPGLASLQKRLNLAAAPETIDCFDISTHQGAETVAASVRYRNGKPDPSEYRHFIIRDAVHDDFASMREAVSRRYASSPLPDLIVIDGGNGQLSAAGVALASQDHVTVIALAKKEEEIYVPGLSFALRMDDKDPGLLLLRRIRDATHRFVIGHHRGRRRKAMSASMLDHVSGIGAARKDKLYKRFGTFEHIAEASKKELQDVLGERTGTHLYKRLHDAAR